MTSRKMFQTEALPGEDLRASLRGWCRSRHIRLGVLFGSVASGRERESSDVDLAVWPGQPPAPRERLTWLAELERATGRKIGLVVVSSRLDPVLGMELVRKGRAVHEAEPGIWNRERARLWHRFEDSLPFRRALEKRLAATARDHRGA